MEAVVPIRELESVTDQPEARLTQWKVVRVMTRDGSVQADFAYGWDPRTGEGRLSTTVVSCGPVQQTAITSSGRRYRFMGSPGHCADGEYVFHQRFAAVLNQCDIEDVSNLYARPTARRKNSKDAKKSPVSASERKTTRRK